MPNYFMETAGVWLPIDSLASDYKGPVIYTDESQTVQWFDKTGQKRTAVDHKEHKRSADGVGFAFNDDGSPVTETRKVKPAFWAPARIAD